MRGPHLIFITLLDQGPPTLPGPGATHPSGTRGHQTRLWAYSTIPGPGATHPYIGPGTATLSGPKAIPKPSWTQWTGGHPIPTEHSGQGVTQSLLDTVDRGSPNPSWTQWRVGHQIPPRHSGLWSHNPSWTQWTGGHPIHPGHREQGISHPLPSGHSGQGLNPTLLTTLDRRSPNLSEDKGSNISS